MLVYVRSSRLIISLTVVLLLLLLASCQDRRNITLSGQLVDGATGAPIAHGEVVALCWYQHNFYETSYKKQALTADHEGRFEATFDQGHQVDIAAKAPGYQPWRKYTKLEDNELTVILELTRVTDNPTLVSVLTTDGSLSDGDAQDTFLRVRIPALENRQKLDFERAQTFGYSLSTSTSSSDTTQADLWFRIEAREGQPTTLATPHQGGLIPILRSEVESSLLFEQSIAPTSGYVTTYELTGSEDGFFIRCRDGNTFGKLILEKSAISISSPDGQGGSYEEFGKRFSYLYQPNGTTNLTYPNAEVDLENFLVDFRMW